MKKFLGIALIAAMALSITACGSSESSKNDDSSDIKPQTTSNNATEDTSVEANTDSTESTASSWLGEQTFGTPSKSFEGTLFNDQVVLPLDLTTIDDYAAPYRYYPHDQSGSADAKSINEILTSTHTQKYTENALSNEGTTIRVQSYPKDSSDLDVSNWDRDYCGLGKIQIDNFSENEETLTIGECIENGWWSLTADDNGNHAKFLQVDAGKTSKEMADNIIKKFGTPTYIAPWFDESPDLETFISSLTPDSFHCYSLIYEYDEFVLDISIQEGYDTFKVASTNYYTPEVWEVRKNTSYQNALFEM